MAEILHKDLLGDDIHELRITIGSAAPSTTPRFVGQGYYDIVARKFYVSQGTSLVTDWVTMQIPPFLTFADTRTITWSSTQIGNEITYQASVEETELVLTATNISNFSTAVLSLPEIISLIADQHTRLIMRTGSEAGGWSPVEQGGLELDSAAQKIRLSQNLSAFGNPQFDEVTLIARARVPLLTITEGGLPTAASIFIDSDKGLIARGYAGSASSLTLQNELGVDFLRNPVGSDDIIAPSLALVDGGIVHADAAGLLTNSKLVNADVNAAAAIEGTKITPNFGSQNITTTGSILVDVIESNTNDIGILTGNDNKSIAIGTGSGYNTINIGGLNSTVNINGATYTTPIEYVSEDKNIVVNFNASGQSSQDSGVYVQEEYDGALIDLLDAIWQSGNTVRYSVDAGGSGIDGLIAGEYIRVENFVNIENNGTFKVLSVNSAYIDVINPERTNATKDESAVTLATAARLLLNGYAHIGPTRSSWEFKAPAHLGVIELMPQSAAKSLLITSESVDDVIVKFNTNLTIDQNLQKTSSVEFGAVKISSLNTGVAHLDLNGNISSSLISDVDISGTAAISGTKITPNFGNQDITTTGGASSSSVKVTGNEAVGGSNVYKSAVNGLMIRGIAGTSSEVRILSELGTNLITIEASGQTTLHHLSTTGVVKATAGVLSSSLITNADISNSAAISGSKINSNFGSQTVQTTGAVQAGSLAVSGLAALNGGQKVKLSSIITSNYTASASDYMLQVNTTSNAITITMPSAAAAESGAIIVIKDAGGNAGVNNIFVAASGSDTIDGGGYAVSDPYGAVSFVSDGISKWLVI
jgi:hypothetical protein